MSRFAPHAVLPMGGVGATGVLSLLGVLAVATGAKYLWDAAMTPAKARVEPRAAQPAEALEHPKG